MPESTPLFGIVKPTSGAEPADLYGVATRLADSVEEALAGLGQWEEYTPTWAAATTNPTLGNGTLSGKYAQVGKLVFFRIELSMGSTTTYGSGNYAFSLPVTPATYVEGVIGNALLFDSSAPARTLAMGRHNGSGSINLVRTEVGTIVTATTYAWATNDKISISGTYEAAA